MSGDVTTRMVWQYAAAVEKHPAHLLTQWQVRSLTDCPYCGTPEGEHCLERDNTRRCANHFERVVAAVKIVLQTFTVVYTGERYEQMPWDIVRDNVPCETLQDQALELIEEWKRQRERYTKKASEGAIGDEQPVKVG